MLNRTYAIKRSTLSLTVSVRPLSKQWRIQRFTMGVTLKGKEREGRQKEKIYLSVEMF